MRRGLKLSAGRFWASQDVGSRRIQSTLRLWATVASQVRDTGNTYEADLIVIRPGAPTQHIDAMFRVEAGKITAINLTSR